MKIFASELVDDDAIALFQQRMGRHLVDGEDESSDQERQNKPHTDTETPCTKLLHIKKSRCIVSLFAGERTEMQRGGMNDFT